jgi:TRAP transporter TAXI family solute receptor
MHPNLLKRLLIFCSLAMLILLAWFALSFYFQLYRPVQLSICTGRQSGEGFHFAQAIQKVIQTHYAYKIRNFTLLETPGSEANVDSIEQNRTDFALLQADVAHFPDNGGIIAILYADLFQLVVRKGSGIQHLRDLKGKRVALPEKGSGQYTSFWALAHYYGLKETDIQAYYLSGTAIQQRLLLDSLDATFAVRALGNHFIQDLLRTGKASLIPIDDFEALHIDHPSLDLKTIPRGAYGGNPYLPAEATPTIAVPRLLVAHNNTDKEAVRLVTQLLFERRNDLIKALGPEYQHLSGSIMQPDGRQGTFIPLHPGAQAFYDRKKPNFFTENIELFGVLISILLPLISGALGWYTNRKERQKNTADQYAKAVMAIVNDLPHTHDLEGLNHKREAMLQILNRVMEDLDNDVLNLEGFHLFSFAWEMGYQALQERHHAVQSEQQS